MTPIDGSALGGAPVATSSVAFRAWILLSTCGLVAIVLLPITWGIVTSLKTEVKAVAYPPSLWPDPFTMSNYARVVTHKTFLVECMNSIIYAVGAVLLALLVAGPAGYAASRFEFRGKRALMLFILLASMIPGVALLAPTYFALDYLGLVNSPIAIVIISAARLAPQTVWFMQNFIDAVPVEIEDAAAIDGASRFQIITRIVLPLIKPGLAATFILGVITTWNDYITVATFAPDIARRTLQVALVNQAFDSIGMSWSYFMAFAIVASVPAVVIFVLAQKWFVHGLTAGGLKG